MRSRAFTLIELLATIAIVGVLAGILIPTVSSMRTGARTARCVSNLRQLAQAGQLWMADNKGHMPDANLWQATSDVYSLRPYLGISSLGDEKQLGVFTCPEAYARHPDPVGGLTDNLRTYSINLYACRTQNGAVSSDVASNAGLLSALPRPAQTSFFMDGDLQSAHTSVRRYVHTGMAAPGNGWTPERPYGLLAVHRGSLNVAFVDGHVETRRFDSIPNTASEGSVTRAQRHPFWGRYPQ